MKHDDDRQVPPAKWDHIKMVVPAGNELSSTFAEGRVLSSSTCC